METLDVDKWTEVATRLAKEIGGVQRYSAAECQRRVHDLENGTALLPIELDPNKEQRAQLREDRIEAIAQSIEDKYAVAEEGQRRAEDFIASKKAEKEAKDLSRQLEKANFKKVHKERLERRQELAEINEYNKAFEQWEGLKIRFEEVLLKRLSGVATDQGRPTRRSKRALAGQAGNELSSKRQKNEVAEVTLETLRNPRSIMSMAELGALITTRNLPRSTTNETHAQLVARLIEEHANASAGAINDWLYQGYFVRRKGSKLDRLEKLEELDAKNSARGSEGITSIDPDFVQSYAGYREHGIEPAVEDDSDGEAGDPMIVE